MENIDVTNEQGIKTGEVLSREEVHTKGLWHRTVHIFVANSKNEILLQKRAPEKKTHPNKWTTSASGHLSAGDESRQGAVRELGEEIGIKAEENELEYLFTIKEQICYKQRADRELVDVYLVRKDFNLKDLQLQKEEVSDVKWITLEEFKNEIQDFDKYEIVPHFEMFSRVIEILESRK